MEVNIPDLKNLIAFRVETKGAARIVRKKPEPEEEPSEEKEQMDGDLNSKWNNST